MKNSKLLTFICLTLLCCSLTVSADEPKKQTAQTKTNLKPKVKLKPDYKETPSQDTYKRAIFVGVDESISKEAMDDSVEKNCRTYSPRRRESYFITFMNTKSGKEIKTIPCSEIKGPAIEAANKKPNKKSLNPPSIIQ